MGVFRSPMKGNNKKVNLGNLGIVGRLGRFSLADFLEYFDLVRIVQNIIAEKADFLAFDILGGQVWVILGDLGCLGGLRGRTGEFVRQPARKHTVGAEQFNSLAQTLSSPVSRVVVGQIDDVNISKFESFNKPLRAAKNHSLLGDWTRVY